MYKEAKLKTYFGILGFGLVGIAVITTKINAINLYIHLSQIPDQKIVQLVQEINTELVSFQSQLDEIKVQSEIKIEDGESDMLKMLDTTRASPSNPNPKIPK